MLEKFTSVSVNDHAQAQPNAMVGIQSNINQCIEFAVTSCKKEMHGAGIFVIHISCQKSHSTIYNLKYSGSIVYVT